MKKQNYILTTCNKLSQFAVYRFVESLRETSFCGKLVLFADKEDLIHLKENTDTVFDIDIVVVDSLNHPITNRFNEYLKFLKKITDVEDIYICDCRDFLFQKNVFDFPFESSQRYWMEPKKDIYFTMECGFIHECNINKNWISDFVNIYSTYLGGVGLNDFLNKRVSCAGAIYGSKKGILSYLEIMSNFISMEKSALSGEMLVDQAIHNYILHFNQLPNIKIGMLDNKDGLVNHVSWGIARNTSFVSASGNIVNQDGDIAYSVHLYDRNSFFLNQMIRSPKWSKYPLELKSV
jgi:hypothetical protein